MASRVAVDGRRGQGLAHVVAMTGRDTFQHLLAFDQAAAPAEQRSGDLGHEDLVGREVPFPDAAARGFHGHPEPLLRIHPRRLNPLDAAHLQDQEDAQRDRRAERRQEPGHQFQRVGREVDEPRHAESGDHGEQADDEEDGGARIASGRGRTPTGTPFRRHPSETLALASGQGRRSLPRSALPERRCANLTRTRRHGHRAVNHIS